MTLKATENEQALNSIKAMGFSAGVKHIKNYGKGEKTMIKDVLFKNRNKLNLQLFADPADPTTEPNGGTNEPATEPTKPTEQKPSAEQPKYTDADVDEIINKRFAKWQKEQEKKTSEAERLGRMTEAEKNAERMKSLEEKVLKYERDAARAEMTKQARAILQGENINVSDELLSNLVADDADKTKASVESFIKLFKGAVEKAVKEAYKGTTPKKGGGAASLTKEQILAVSNRAERQKLISENMELFQ
jgi:hypothetical protein